MTESVKGLTLEGLYDLAYRAYSGISFSPEKRAVHVVNDFSKELDSDLLELGDNPGSYKEKYINYLSAWLRAMSNCISTMIAGPSNFPVRRAEKANNSERNRYDKFRAWRERYFKAVNRVPRPSIEDDLANQTRKLADLEIKQEGMKQLNKILKKYGYDLIKADDAIKEAEIPQSAINEMYNGCIQGFTLTNNNAKIKNTRDRITALENRLTFQSSFESIEFPGGSITVEDDRVKIFNDSKPEQEVIDLYKKNGFRWSPNWKCWVRQLTDNAMFAVKHTILPAMKK